MATIPRTGPDLSIGGRTAQPVQPVNIQPITQPSQMISAAGDRLGEAARLYEDHQQQQLTAKMALALASAQNGAHDAHDAVAMGLSDGSIAPQDADTELRRRMDNVVASQTQGLPKTAANAVRTQMLGTQGNLQRSMAENVFHHNQSETAATIDETGTQLQRDVLRRGPSAVADTYDAVIDMTGSSAGFSPAQIQQKKTAFRQDTTAGYYAQKGSQFHADGDLAGVSSTLGEVLGPAGEQMSQTQRSMVTNHLVGLQDHLVAKQNRDADAADRERVRRENEAVDAVNAVRTVVLNGSFLSTDAIADASAKAAGTSQAAPLSLILASQSKIAGFAALPADQRAAQLQAYRAEGANPAVGTSPQNQQSIEILNKVDEKANAAAKDDPWKAAQTYGVITNAPVLNVADPNSMAPALDYRMQQIGKVEAWVGHKVSPFQPAEAQQLGEELKGMPASQAAGMLSIIGQSVNDSDRIAAVAKQLHDKDGTIGIAMAYAGDRTESGKLTAEYILLGAQALKDKTSQVDNAVQSGWRATIAKEVRGAFSSQQAEDDAIEAAFKITAARDASGESSGDTKTAIRMATGGIITHGQGKIPLPINMDESTFDKRLAAVTPASLAPQAPDGNAYVAGVAVPLAKFAASLPDATLVHAGQGMYAVRAGTSFVTNKDGQRIVLRISQ